MSPFAADPERAARHRAAFGAGADRARAARHRRLVAELAELARRLGRTPTYDEWQARGHGPLNGRLLADAGLERRPVGRPGQLVDAAPLDRAPKRGPRMANRRMVHGGGPPS